MRRPKYEITYSYVDEKGKYVGIQEYYNNYNFSKGMVEYLKSHDNIERIELRKRSLWYGGYKIMDVWRKTNV